MKARLAEIARSTPLRLALALIILFSLVSFLSLAAAYAVTQRSFDQAMRADLLQDMAGFRAAPTATALAQLVEAEARDTDPKRLVLSYLAPNQRYYGNARIARDGDGYHIIAPSPGNPQIAGRYLSLTASLLGGQLTIARSLSEVEALGDLFRNILVLSLIPTVLIAMSGGLILARRSAAYVRKIGETLEELTGGDVRARVMPESGWPGDLSAIGQKIDTMADAQEASVEAIRQVSSDIAHDLKSPIQRVAVHLDDLKRNNDLGDEAHHLLDKAKTELAGIISVFHSLLQIAHIETGSPMTDFGPVDLSALCEVFFELYEPSALEQDHMLEFKRPSKDKSFMVMGDRDLLGQMAANLIENALWHTPRGTHIKLSLTQRADRITLSVADNGTGIPPQERDLVLRRLYRMDRSRSTPGNGLGLSLVRSIAMLHDAELCLRDNKPGLNVEVSFASKPPRNHPGEDHLAC